MLILGMAFRKRLSGDTPWKQRAAALPKGQAWQKGAGGTSPETGASQGQSRRWEQAEVFKAVIISRVVASLPVILSRMIAE